MQANRRQPDFLNLLKILRRQRPDRPTLFEFFLNTPLYAQLAGPDIACRTDPLAQFRIWIHAFANAGYDYATVAWDFKPLVFPKPEKRREKTISLNDGGVITDRAAFERYPWPNLRDSDYDRLAEIEKELIPGMKLILFGPGGVLENTIDLVGYDTLCFMLADDPNLARDVFDAVGARLVEHYRLGCRYEGVGAAISNDDWGFKTQTMISPAHLRRHVFPWHRRIVQAIHAAGKPAILHSCGHCAAIIDEVIDDLGYNGRHSYEDTIMPVEEAYERYGQRIAVLGGIDLDFLVRSTPEQITRRSRAMLERAEARGGYALGSGNSIPEYVPVENYLAMIGAATG